MSSEHADDDPAVRGLEDAANVAEAGESGATPLILGFQVWVVTAAAVLVVLAASLLAYYLA
jgi:hypothetical protein